MVDYVDWFNCCSHFHGAIFVRLSVVFCAISCFEMQQFKFRMLKMLNLGLGQIYNNFKIMYLSSANYV